MKNVQNGVFLRGSGPTFLVSDDLKILPSSMASSVMMLAESCCSAAFIQLEEITHNIGKQEMLNLLKYTLTSHEPLTNCILKSSSKIKHNPPNQSASAVREIPCTSSNRKMDIKVIQSKSQKKIVITEVNGDFVDFIFGILTMPLGAIVKLLGPNSFAGCVSNLYKSVENLEPTSVLLDILYVEPVPTTYYYGKKEGRGVISKSRVSIDCPRCLYLLDSKHGNWSKEDDVGFVKRPTLYAVGDDLKVKPFSANFRLSNIKGLSLSFEDLEVKVISIGDTEALSLLGAFLTSKFTLTIGLQDFLKVPKQESTFKGN